MMAEADYQGVSSHMASAGSESTYVVQKVLRLCSWTIPVYPYRFCMHFNNMLLTLQQHVHTVVWPLLAP